MTEIEKLRADIKTLEKAQADQKNVAMQHFPPGHWKDIPEWAIITELKAKLAALEAQAAEADKWQYARAGILEIQSRPHIFAYSTNVLAYIQHLIDENKRLEAELADANEEKEASERWESVYNSMRVRAESEAERLKAENADLKAELAKRPETWCLRNKKTGKYLASQYVLQLFKSKNDAIAHKSWFNDEYDWEPEIFEGTQEVEINKKGPKPLDNDTSEFTVIIEDQSVKIGLLKSEVDELKAELAKRPVVWCAKHKTGGALVTNGRGKPVLWTQDEMVQSRNRDHYDFKPYTGDQK